MAIKPAQYLDESDLRMTRAASGIRQNVGSLVATAAALAGTGALSRQRSPACVTCGV